MPPGIPDRRPHAGARLGIPDGHIVTMVHRQVGEKAIVAVGRICATSGRPQGRRAGADVDLRPTDTINRAAAGIARDSHTRPTIPVAVFKIERAPVVGLHQAAAILRDVDRKPTGAEVDAAAIGEGGCIPAK